MRIPCDNPLYVVTFPNAFNFPLQYPIFSAKNLLSSRNCYFSPTQCFLPRIFDKYIPAQNTSSVIGRRARRIRTHHHRALAYMTTNIRNKILQPQASKKL